MAPFCFSGSKSPEYNSGMETLCSMLTQPDPPGTQDQIHGFLEREYLPKKAWVCCMLLGLSVVSMYPPVWHRPHIMVGGTGPKR